MSNGAPDSLNGGAGRFLTTQWSVVLSATNPADTRSGDALGKLCQAYWYPLYAFVRRRGHSPHDAQDLTQEFFARLLEKNYLAAVDRTKGKFRTFLLTAMEHFLANEWNRAHRQKRGGGYEFVSLSLNADEAEARYIREPADHTTPEKLFERRWALTLLEHALDRLAGEFEAAGNGALFKQLKGCLSGDRTRQPYTEVAAQLGMTEGAVKVAAHRLRERYRELMREEIAQTVSAPGEVDEEIRLLFQTLAG